MVAGDQNLPEQAPSRVGQVLCGKYRLDRVLGVGGMATVYAATHLRNANRVAVKILRRELSFDLNQRARFVREGYAANTVGHPGTVRVLDDDTAEDGSAFIVMDLIEGESLATRWERSDRRLGSREVTTILIDLLDVLVVAHGKQIVHRDLKPENLLLGRDGRLRVLDFGVARLREGNASVTKSGALFGTPAFMAPEQALGRTSEVDAQSDLWAVGATAFTLLAGRFVHPGRTIEEMLVLSATQRAPPLALMAPEVPQCLAAVVDRALAFEKSARWPNSHAMRAALIAADAAMRAPENSVEVPEPEAEKTTLSVPSELTPPGTHGHVPGVQSHTIEISTLRDVSTVAGVAALNDGTRPRRRPSGAVIFAALVAATTALALGLLLRQTTTVKRQSTAVAIPEAVSQATTVAPIASARAPSADVPAFDVEALPVAKPTASAVVSPIRAILPPKPAVNVPRSSLSLPTQATALAPAPPSATHDPLAP
jgi:serine/threonine-protein kinase